MADQAPRGIGDHHTVGGCSRLQPRGQVQRIADCQLLARGADADRISDDHETGRDADADLQLVLVSGDRLDRRNEREAGSDGALRIGFVGPGPAKIDEGAIAQVAGDVPVELRHGIGDRAVIAFDDVMHLLRIDARGKRRRADKIAEHHRQLPAFSCRCCRGSLWFRILVAAQRSNRRQQLATVPYQADAKVVEVLGCKLAQNRSVNRVVAKRLFILLQAETVEPCRNVHALLPAAVTPLRLSVPRNVGVREY